MISNISAFSTMAWRNLWRNYRRTFIMLAAISVGVWAMIFLTALMRGMVDDMVSDGIHSLPGEIQIHHTDYRHDPNVVNSMPEPKSALLAALNSPQVKHWSSRIKVPAVIASERDTRGISLVGIDPTKENNAGYFQEEIIRGEFLTSSDDRGLVLGQRLAEKLETSLGKRVVIMSQDPDNNVVERGFRIVGIFSAEISSREEQLVYAGRDSLQDLLNINGLVSEIAITGQSDYRTNQPLLTKLRQITQEKLEVLPWQELDLYLSGTLGMMDGFILVWMVVVFLALSFGLINTLMMAVFERIAELGLMMALGMRPARILLLILAESLMLLFFGLVLGNLIALLTIWPLQSGIDLSIVAEGMAMAGMSPVIYPSLYLGDVIMADMVVLVLGLFASLLPAWHAARINPIHALSKH